MRIHSAGFGAYALASAMIFASPVLSTASLAADPARRIVSIGGSVTEIVYALGEQDRLIGRDSTSLYPEAVMELPDIGYIRRLSPEGVLSVDPDLIVTLEGAGPPEAVAVLKSAKVNFASIPERYDAAGVVEKIKAVGLALDTPVKAANLAARVNAELEKLSKVTAPIKRPRKVLFILSTQGGKILASGRGTAASGIIALSGGENAITGFTGYKALTDEAIITAAPDAILMMNRRGDHSMDDADLLAHPAIALTPAAESRSVVRMDGLYLLGFGPRTARAAIDLARALYGDAIETT